MQKKFEDMLVEQCAPTLAGLKPGSLFRFSDASFSSTRAQVRCWDERLTPLGIRVTILKECPVTGASMIYVYRPELLDKILREPDVLAFLSGYGYGAADISGMLSVLSGRYCMEKSMPHEIGIFLGYPLEDVVGFIEHEGKDFTCCGYWKSYGDPEAAQQRFSLYRACNSTYRELYRCGTPIIELIAA